jgi:hypothetical protein
MSMRVLQLNLSDPPQSIPAKINVTGGSGSKTRQAYLALNLR